MSCALMGAEDADAPRRAHARASRPAAPRPTACSRSSTPSARRRAPRPHAAGQLPLPVPASRHETFDALIDDLAPGDSTARSRRTAPSPAIRQRIPADRGVGAKRPTTSTTAPEWMPAPKRRRAGIVHRAPRIPTPPASTPATVPRSSRRGSSTRTSYTLERYLATGGYEGLKAALDQARTEIHDEVKNATVLGRGGAGFPAGTKWGLTPPERVPALPRRQRRRERARHLQGPPADGARSRTS